MAMASVTTVSTTPMGMKVHWPHSLHTNPMVVGKSLEHRQFLILVVSIPMVTELLIWGRMENATLVHGILQSQAEFLAGQMQ